MNPRPFYRSRLFWLGLPGLVFLLWGWWLSTGHWSEVGSEAGIYWGIGQLGGEVYAFWDLNGPPDWGQFESANPGPGLTKVGDLKRTLAVMREIYPTYRSVFIPYYWLILAYTAAWLLTLALWQRRKSRHTAP